RAWPGASPEGFRIERDIKTAVPDLPPSVSIYDAEGKASGFIVKNPDGIGIFSFGDKCFLSNGSIVKFIAEAMPKDPDALDTQVYVKYTGNIQLSPSLRPIKAAFCPEHAVVIMPLNDYLAFHKIASQAEEERKYLRTLLGSTRAKQ
ncbi:MAG: hypothetical protein HYT94_02100, partial [Parcubacteria group bacterium]|nr:hypothetical protein [Parcubacteria group bacterium]